MTAPDLIPDSHLVHEVARSPNHNERRGGLRPEIIVLHYTGMPSAEAALERLCQHGSDVSAHYFIHEDGRIVQCVPEARRAWHAGESSWAGAGDINSRSIGIEIVNPGHDLDYADYPDVQIGAVIALVRDILVRRRIHSDRVLAHSDVAPLRKQDPGEKFPWARLAAAGIGHWVEPEPIAGAGQALSVGDEGPEVRALQAELAEYGYGIPVSGRYDAETSATVAAFQRHFRPARVDGVADISTRTTLAKLLATRSAGPSNDAVG